MKFINLAEDRYSLRKFNDKSVEKEKLDLVLKAGQLAPTAGNLQPQRILVIESSEAMGKLKKCTPCHFNAPMVLLVCYDNAISAKRSYDDYDTGDADASIVATHMMLQIAELGLGSTWVAHFDPAAVRKEFSLPERFVPVALLPLGYPAEDAAPNAQMHHSRKPIEETVFYNQFS
jgi:nitroreductase